MGAPRPRADHAEGGPAGGLVWLVDGRERPFSDPDGADEAQRPWLEDSLEWLNSARKAAKQADPEPLIWL